MCRLQVETPGDARQGYFMVGDALSSRNRFLGAGGLFDDDIEVEVDEHRVELELLDGERRTLQRIAGQFTGGAFAGRWHNDTDAQCVLGRCNRKQSEKYRYCINLHS